MNGRLAGKIAIVTGGGRGIGRAIVERFLAEGAQVMVAGRNEPDLPFAGGPSGPLFCRTDVACATGLPLAETSPEMWEKAAKQYAAFVSDKYEWPALLRQVDRIDPSYKY